jgi:hypothetical protein
MDANLKQAMKLWRMGEVPMPQDYVVLHKVAALADLPRLLAKLKLTPLGTRMVSDGWMDGMRVVQAKAVGDPWNDDRVRTLQWSDANGGSWFENGALVEVAPDRPGYA